MKKSILAFTATFVLFIPLLNTTTLDAKDVYKTKINGKTIKSPYKIDQRWSAEDPHHEGHSTHLWIINRAIDIMTKTADPAIKQSEVQELQAWKTQLEQGLYDADHQNPYYNSYTFSSHFYDPDTKKNWLDTSETALTQGSKYFALAGKYYQDGNKDKAFYTLGLSLHYLTDVTQSMHAANFTWINWPTSFHGKFEDYAESVQTKYAVTDGNGYWDWKDEKPESWIHAAAVDAKADFPIIYNSDVTKWFIEAAVSNYYSDKWHNAVLPNIEHRLTESQRITAGYIHLWFKTYVNDFNGPVALP